MGCESIIRVFFHMLLNIKLYHWDTTNYARHKASDDLHANISALIDQFIEVFIGRYERPKYESPFKIQVKQYDDKTIVLALKDYVLFLEEEVPKFLSKTDTELFNIRDEMLSTINQTLYLFTLE